MLGAGGILGAAWLAGALHAIATESGWDPGSADHVVGTSAGSIVGALLACGVPPWLMVAHSSGEARRRHGRQRGAGRAHRPLERGEPPSPPRRTRGRPRGRGVALGSLARPYRHSPAALIAGVLPDGLVSTEPIRDTIRSACSGGWAPHPHLWRSRPTTRPASACRLARPARPRPSWRTPLRLVRDPGLLPIDRHRRPALCRRRRALDLEPRHPRRHGLDLVICLNPTSSLHAAAPRTLGERLAFSLRQGAGRRLGAETARVQRAGAEVVLVQPTVHDLDAMGTNLMNRGRRHAVVEAAARSVTEHLRDSAVGERLQRLPAGISELVARPPGTPVDWPDLESAARRRGERVAARDASRPAQRPLAA